MVREPHCGCTIGAIAALLALVCYGGYLALWSASAVPPSWRARVLTGLALTFSAAVMGKLSGIVYQALRDRGRQKVHRAKSLGHGRLSAP